MKRSLLSTMILVVILSMFLSASVFASNGPLVLATNNAPEGKSMAKALEEFGKLKNIEVEVVEAPYANLFEKELLDLSKGTGLYDIILLDDPWFTQFAENDWLTELSSYFLEKKEAGLSADFIDKSQAICRYPYAKGLLYAVPAVGNAQMFFYRKDLFEKYNMFAAPATWEEAYEVMLKIKENEDGVFGYVLRGQQGNPVVAQFMPIFWSFNAKMFNEDKTEVWIDTPEALNALNFFIELKEISPPGAESFNAQQLATYMLQGKAATTINWPAFVPTFEDPKQSKIVGKIAYAPIPSAVAVGASEIGHWLAAIPAGSKNKDMAFEFIHWATSAEKQKELALKWGNPPTRKSVFQDPELLAMSEFRHYPVLLQAISNSKPRPRISNWNEVENTFGIHLSKAVAGQVSPKEALVAAQKEVEKLMEKAGYIK